MTYEVQKSSNTVFNSDLNRVSIVVIVDAVNGFTVMHFAQHRFRGHGKLPENKTTTLTTG